MRIEIALYPVLMSFRIQGWHSALLGLRTPMRHLIWVLCALMVACGGGGGSAAQPFAQSLTIPTPIPTQTPAISSAGGIWVDPGTQAIMYIAENGNLVVQTDIEPISEGAAFGLGSLTVDDSNQVSGTFRARTGQPGLSSPPSIELDCELNGPLAGRETLFLMVTCLEAGDLRWEESLDLLPHLSAIYEQDSSLARVTGSYQLGTGRNADSTPILISENGMMSGRYHNGANCDLNGQVSVIDTNYNMYQLDWTFGNCVQPFPQFEGSIWSGLGYYFEDVVDGSIRFRLIMGGDVSGDFRTISNSLVPDDQSG